MTVSIYNRQCEISTNRVEIRVKNHMRESGALMPLSDVAKCGGGAEVECRAEGCAAEMGVT